MKEVLLGVALFLTLIMLSWGTYWAAKNLSYNFWYNDMVEQTIKEMVKPEALRGGK